MSGITGGCQCGAIRFSAERLGRASICHCRMCQKASGGFFGPFVDVKGFVWTRGEPKRFQSSNLVQRGFCGDCGTPLSFEPQNGRLNVYIGAFDDPSQIAPTIQLGLEGKLAYVDALGALPLRPAEEVERAAAHYDAVVSNQHPDHDT
jgi:hypothetical protein